MKKKNWDDSDEELRKPRKKIQESKSSRKKGSFK